MRQKEEAFINFPAIFLHPKTIIHEIKGEISGKGLSVVVDFTAPLEVDFGADEDDMEPGTLLTPRALRLIGALAHSESIISWIEGSMTRTDTMLSARFHIETPRCVKTFPLLDKDNE